MFKFMKKAAILKAMLRGNFSCNLQRNGVSSCVLQKKSPPATLLVCKIIRLQVIQQLAYVYNSTGACDIFFHPNLRCKLQKWFLYVRCFSGQISAWRFLIRSFFYAGCLLYKIEQIWLLVMYLF